MCILSRVLKQLGSKHVLVVCGEGGLDEITLTGKTRVAELKDGEIREYDISPADFGIESAAIWTKSKSSTRKSLWKKWMKC